MAELLQEKTPQIEEANRKDIDSAAKKGIPGPTVKRLVFDSGKIGSRINSLHKIAALPDPIGKVTDFHRTENGLSAGRMRIPLGVILMIYEARPHVTVNGGALCFKAGNSVILRGGSEAARCNALIGNLWQQALTESELPAETIQVFSGSHDDVEQLLQMKEYIDLVIPRGSRELIQHVSEKSKIPVIKHSAGICHVYLDASADIEKGINIAIDSKCLMPSVCNAAETLLVAETLAPHLPQIINRLVKEGIEVKGCKKTRAAAGNIGEAEEKDWTAEYLEKIYSVRVVKGIDEAIEHINIYGSHHTDAIVTEDYTGAQKFLRQVDSAVVLVNASTMFCDGETLGMGAEVGISTDKIHARGPVGIEDLTSYKHIIYGSGQIMGR